MKSLPVSVEAGFAAALELVLVAMKNYDENLSLCLANATVLCWFMYLNFFFGVACVSV